ncbi:hypothetical protein COCON_G00048070 [Conger conger]|uniref:C3H1-type domain-containing protein n=1 Tax=Conger conger TaxID=82655 RepID=A0A9Q1DUY6_CONCO|nr:hypothetical protein COCON_G00048070 [Conger conger]
MIIENVEALKSWLAKLLEPICDADPSALANYVVALVKKDKPEKDLRALCADQLDVFLQKETTGFVDKLFECLTTKNYLGNPEPIKEIKVEPKLAVLKQEDREEPGNAEEERDGRRRRSPLRNRSDINESRARDDRRRDDRKRQHRSKFEQERKEQEGYIPTAVPACSSLLPLPPPPPPHHQLSSGAPVLPSSVTVVVPAHLPDGTSESWSNYFSNHSEGKQFNKSGSLKRRCRDYDEKGFCVRGDLCPFDHGNDPLIVDDVTLPTMIPFPPRPACHPPLGCPCPR